MQLQLCFPLLIWQIPKEIMNPNNKPPKKILPIYFHFARYTSEMCPNIKIIISFSFISPSILKADNGFLRGLNRVKLIFLRNLMYCSHEINLGLWRNEIIMRNWFQLLKTLSQAKRISLYLILLWRIPLGRFTNRREKKTLTSTRNQY